MPKAQEAEKLLIDKSTKMQCLACSRKLAGEVGKVWWCSKCDYGRLDGSFDRKVYDAGYAKKYEGYLYSEQGEQLNDFRVDFVLTYAKPSKEKVLLDYGCASGGFAHKAAKFWKVIGYDVNTVFAQYWDKRKKSDVKEWGEVEFRITPPTEAVDILTCFDSLEHVTSPGGLLVYYAPKCVFISIPLVEKKRLLTSRHYRTDEHLHYFTHKSLVRFMRKHKYNMLKKSARETELGREDVWTYAFYKKK